MASINSPHTSSGRSLAAAVPTAVTHSVYVIIIDLSALSVSVPALLMLLPLLPLPSSVMPTTAVDNDGWGDAASCIVVVGAGAGTGNWASMPRRSCARASSRCGSRSASCKGFWVGWVWMVVLCYVRVYTFDAPPPSTTTHKHTPAQNPHAPAASQ